MVHRKQLLGTATESVLRPFVSSLALMLVSATAYAVTYVVPPDDVLVRKAGAIVIARALTSYAVESPEHGIETVTVLSVEDVLKGNLSNGAEVKVRVIGGVLEDRAKVIAGAPQFAEGERALIFLTELDSGDYGVTDFGLGHFAFATDDTGREVLIRGATEIRGWNLDGTVHREMRRDAKRFLTFIRGVARHLPAKREYTVEPRPIIGDGTGRRAGRLVPITNAFTVTQYTLANAEGDNGFRWKVFPTAVNWNRGNTQPGAPNGGNDAINAAFGSWNGDSLSNTNYVFATTNANTDGIEEAADGINNIVFEKDLGAPINDFSCSTGGVLGLGGISAALTDATNIVNGETFFRTTEGDVSMNKGVGACLGVSFTVANYNSAVTHEFGHTLGKRHSDQTRTGAAACTTQPMYDCATSAIMTASVTSGLNAALQPWDQAAVRALYPGAPPATPTGVVAIATSGTSVNVTWNAVTGATYEVYRRAGGGVFTLVGSPGTNAFTDSVGLSANTSYLYRVRAVSGGVSSADSAHDLATTAVYTDPTLIAGVTPIKAAHITEMRTIVDAVRALAGIGAGAYDETITAGVTPARAHHIDELRQFLEFGLINANIGFPAPTYSRPTLTPGSTVITIADISELRLAVR